MAMTKAEKAYVEQLETALALHWPSYAAPRPMTREEIESAKVEVTPRDRTTSRGRTRVALGWFYNSYGNGTITKGWSDGLYHNRDNTTGDNASQNMGQMYRTRVEAAMALRLEMTRKFAEQLTAIDKLVRGEE